MNFCCDFLLFFIKSARDEKHPSSQIFPPKFQSEILQKTCLLCTKRGKSATMVDMKIVYQEFYCSFAARYTVAKDSIGLLLGDRMG